MHATADDRYATCPRCRWAGKLRKDGTMRKHREAADAGRIGSTGSLPQQRHGDICKGSGEKPWDHTPPGGGYQIQTTDHGAPRLVTEDEAERVPTLEDVELPSDEADREQARREARPRYMVAQLGTGYFAVVDNVTNQHVIATTSRKHAHDGAAELNAKSEEPKQDPEPSLDDYAKASRIIQSLIPGVRR